MFSSYRKLLVASILLAFALFFAGCSSKKTYNVIIENGLIVDGTGKTSYMADIGIVGDTIEKIGNLSNAAARKRIDAKGLVVAPGFIDAHSHFIREMLNPKASKESRMNEGLVRQGVTTIIGGVDGRATAESIIQLKETATRYGAGINYASYVGHNTIRSMVIGRENRAPTADELDTMKAMVKAGMEVGALGLSSGLMYLPGRYAETEEVIEMAKIVASYDGVYDSHVRDPVKNYLESVIECIEIGEKSGARPHLAHHKAVGLQNFGKHKEVERYIKEALKRGIDVTADQYPYDGAVTSRLIEVFVQPTGSPRDRLLDALKDPKKREAIQKITENPPPEVFSWVETVTYKAFRILVRENFPEHQGRMLFDIAQEKGIDPFTLMTEIVLADNDKTVITVGACAEDDVRDIMQWPWTMIGSDGYPGGHPRSRGNFPRIMGRYVREWNVLSLEKAVHKMTGLPADYFRLEGIGFLKEGYRADIAIFDPETIIDVADWVNPNTYSEGIVHVLVNGIFALEYGEMTGNLNGRFVPFKGGIYVKELEPEQQSSDI